MARRKAEPKETRREFPQALDEEERENQLVNLAIDLAERQIRDGTVSATVLAQYVKLGTSRERLEQQRLANENRLTDARIEALHAAARAEEVYAAAIEAMKVYAGQRDTDD